MSKFAQTVLQFHDCDGLFVFGHLFSIYPLSRRSFDGISPADGIQKRQKTPQKHTWKQKKKEKTHPFFFTTMSWALGGCDNLLPQKHDESEQQQVEDSNSHNDNILNDKQPENATEIKRKKLDEGNTCKQRTCSAKASPFSKEPSIELNRVEGFDDLKAAILSKLPSRNKCIILYLIIFAIIYGFSGSLIKSIPLSLSIFGMILLQIVAPKSSSWGQ